MVQTPSSGTLLSTKAFSETITLTTRDLSASDGAVNRRPMQLRSSVLERPNERGPQMFSRPLLREELLIVLTAEARQHSHRP